MTKRDKSLLAGLCVVLVIIAVIFFVFLPALDRISYMESRISSANIEISNLHSEIEQAFDLMVQINSMQTALDAIEDMEFTYVPMDFDPLEKMRLMQRVLYPHTTRINLGFSSPVLLEGTDDVFVETLHLSFSSSFHDVLEILYNLLEDGPPHRVVNYSITHNIPTGTGMWEFDFYYEEYFFVQDVFGVLTVQMEIDYLTRVVVEEVDENGE